MHMAFPGRSTKAGTVIPATLHTTTSAHAQVPRRSTKAGTVIPATHAHTSHLMMASLNEGRDRNPGDTATSVVAASF